MFFRRMRKTVRLEPYLIQEEDLGIIVVQVILQLIINQVNDGDDG